MLIRNHTEWSWSSWSSSSSSSSSSIPVSKGRRKGWRMQMLRKYIIKCISIFVVSFHVISWGTKRGPRIWRDWGSKKGKDRPKNRSASISIISPGCGVISSRLRRYFTNLISFAVGCSGAVALPVSVGIIHPHQHVWRVIPIFGNPAQSEYTYIPFIHAWLLAYLPTGTYTYIYIYIYTFIYIYIYIYIEMHVFMHF